MSPRLELEFDEPVSETAPHPRLMVRIDARSQRNPWARYEAAKRELPPDLAPAQYEAACRALAKRFGL